MDISTLITAINDAIIDNGNQKITAAVLRPLLVKLVEGLQQNITAQRDSISAQLTATTNVANTASKIADEAKASSGQNTTAINTLGAHVNDLAAEGYKFGGLLPAANPSPKQNMFYFLTAESGSYPYASIEAFEDEQNVRIVTYDGNAWSMEETDIPTNATITHVSEGLTLMVGTLKEKVDLNEEAINTLGAHVNDLAAEGYKFGGLLPAANPSPKQNMFYFLTAESGSYPYASIEAFEDEQNVRIVTYDGNAWSMEETDIPTNATITHVSEGLTLMVGTLKEKVDLNEEAINALLTTETVMVKYWQPSHPEELEEECYLWDSNENKLYSYYEGAAHLVTTPSDGAIYVNMVNNIPYRYDPGKKTMVAIAAPASAEAIYNPTVEIPISGYYSLVNADDEAASAVHVAYNAGKATIGLLITFEKGKNVWKTYQYIGSRTDYDSFTSEANWKDFGSLAEGSENYIVIDNLCGSADIGFYTLESAVTKLINYENEHGVAYIKRGLIISYVSAENEMETKQFHGNVADKASVGLWKDFGGGGLADAKDEPQEGGKDAFSTGGAYNRLPAALVADESEEGVVKLKMLSEGGEQIGDEAQFHVGTGSGGGGGTVVAIGLKNNPLYGSAGGTFIIDAAIMSVTSSGSIESKNTIQTIQLYDRSTDTMVKEFEGGRSSDSMDDYTFHLDVTELFKAAGTNSMQLRVVDDGGHSATKNVSIVAVDVTIESRQTLQYSKDTVLDVGGVARSIPMYAFPNNASAKGIQVKADMLINGEWKSIATPIITDTYSHSLSLDPSGLSHGAYPIRIQGTDVGSGVKGNILYTTIMVVQGNDDMDDYNDAILAARWYDNDNGKVKLLENIGIDFAVFKRNNSRPSVSVYVSNDKDSKVEKVANQVMNRSSYYPISKRITSWAEGTTLTFYAEVDEDGAELPLNRVALIDGSLIPISKTEGAFVDFTFDERSNDDADKSIKQLASDGKTNVTIDVVGSNYTTNGFVKSSFGTAEYGTDSDKGRMSLRIAENVTASCDLNPFNRTDIETNGLVLGINCKVKNIADPNARIVSCMDDGDTFGFYINADGLYFVTDQETQFAPFAVDTDTRFDIVIEPSKAAPYNGVGTVKLYRNGDEAGCAAYTPGKIPSFNKPILFDGTHADFYLYELAMWTTYYNYIAAFNNYLVGLTDTEAMIEEYDKNDVMASSLVDGKTMDAPTIAKCRAAGLVVAVQIKSALTGTADTDYPGYLDTLDGDKKTQLCCDWLVYFPDRPWQDCRLTCKDASDGGTTNQGTTSSMRPIKNKKLKLKKFKVSLLHEEADYVGDADALAKFKECVKYAAKNRIALEDDGKFTNKITIKVDYSDCTGANNGAMMDMHNKTQLALGANYMTPAQNASKDSKKIYTSITSLPCAFFRTDKYSQDASNPSYAYFHAKANFNFDKGDAEVFGLEGVDGYNKKCVNYGDFKELVASRGQSLADFKDAVMADTSSLNPGTMYMLSEFCGEGYHFIENDGSGKMTEVEKVADMVEFDGTSAELLKASVADFDWNAVYHTTDDKAYQYKGGVFKDTTGTMTYDKNSKNWVVTGRVLNPAECFEYLKYDYLCWCQGVNSLDDMLAINPTSEAPIWMSYFESRYPDDDDLNDLYAAGKKVPYSLYKWLKWMQDCNQHLTEADGNITLDGASVPGTAANRLKKYQHELHKVENVYSNLYYTVASDYLATVDQRSKNKMVSFYLYEDMVKRASFQHWYDGDCALRADNDCALSIPWDLDATTDPNHLYQGWDAVNNVQTYALFNEGVWLNDDGSSSLTLSQVAAAMRGVTADGVKAFSAAGVYYYWLTKRILKWAKVTSSYDGERKYVINSKAGANYFYALHGLRIEDLPEYARKRWSFRDGYYQVGDLYSNPFKMRANPLREGSEVTITITAAQDGFFGLGVDRADTCTDKCYLKAGESYTLKSGVTSVGSGTMLYVFGADKVSVLDLSNSNPRADGFDISYCTLLERLIVGGEGYTTSTNSGSLATLDLGNKPFLKYIDARNTYLTNIIANNCPRLETILATGTQLTAVSIAETSPISTLTLPATMTTLEFVNLPNLVYPSGLQIGGFSNVKRLRLQNCPGIDAYTFLEDVINGGAAITAILIDNLVVTSNETLLKALMESGAKGIGTDLTSGCDGLRGIWTLTSLLDDAELLAMQKYFPELALYNAQYTGVVMDDTMTDPQNITNLDNGTSGSSYEPSGHITRIRKALIPIRGKLNVDTGNFEAVKVSESNYQQLANGKDFDYTDSLGEGWDVMMRFPHCWYKGVNDFKNQKKYIYWSSLPTMPRSSASKITRQYLKDCVRMYNNTIMVTSAKVGGTIDDAGVLNQTRGYNIHEIDVEGMKQVRYPGINSDSIGVVFLDADGLIVSKYNMAVSNTNFDFKEGDYIFIDVPATAKTFLFTSSENNAELETIAVDSTDIEAIEPDWVENKAWLCGVYEASIDNIRNLRSISGASVRTGTGTSTTSAEWTYDDNGDPITTPLNKINYTSKDLQNLGKRRGEGYQVVDYEMNKMVALLFYSYVGSRDGQLVCGYGKGSGGTTGYKDDLGNSNSDLEQSSNGNKVLGFESWMACTYEWMTNICQNTVSWDSFWKNKCVEKSADPIDYVFHIYDPIEKTERDVQGLSVSGQEICRTKHGRFCDIIASSTIVDSAWAKYYCDGYYTTGSRGRVVGRAISSAVAYGGLACASASYASSYSSSNYGSRLAFRGNIVISE